MVTDLREVDPADVAVAGRPEDGLVDVTAALETADQFGNQEGRSNCLWHRTEALASQGRADEATACAEEPGPRPAA